MDYVSADETYHKVLLAKTKPTDKGSKKGYLWAVSAPKLGLVFFVYEVADFFGRNIRITVAEPLVLLADIGLDIFQFFIETLSFEALTGSLVRLGIPKGGANGEFAAELRHRTINRDTTHDGNLTMFFRLPFHVEKDFESTALHDNLNFEGLLNVKSSYLLCGNSMQRTENDCLKCK